MKKLFLLSTIALLNSCTFNVSMAHTEGTASEVIDETNSNAPSTSVSLPVKAV